MATFTNLGQNTTNGNPDTTISLTTVNATAAGDKVIVALNIPNSNPVFTTATIDGQALTEIASGRQTRNNKTICVFYYDDATGRASGKTITCTWTNSGTQNGGGSALSAATLTGTNPLTTGAPEQVIGSQGAGPATGNVNSGTTGTPSDTAANYLAISVLGIQGNTVSQETPNNSYTATPQALNTTRGVGVEMAFKELTPTVGAQSTSWAETWGTAFNWTQDLILVKENTPGVPANTVAPAVTGTAAVGSTLTTDNGTWTNTPTGYVYDWQRDVGSGGSTWVSIGASQSCTTTSGSNSLQVANLTGLLPGMGVFGAGIPAGTTITAVVDGTHVQMSQNATASATVTVRFGVDSVNTYTATADDLGCKIRCQVTATNGNGSSTPTPSSASGVVPAPSFPTYRLVLAPVAQSDNQTHSSTLRLPVLAGETLVLLAACSIANTGGDIGQVTDAAGDTWVQRQEYAAGGTGTAQAFSTVCASGMAYGSAITFKVKQTTVAGAVALNATSIPVVATSGGTAGSGLDLSGTININGVAVTYTSLGTAGPNGASLEGCGAHAAYTGGELVQYHGQSPYYYVVALNGGGATVAYDTGAVASTALAAASSGSVTSSGQKAFALGFHRHGGATTWTPGSGWTEVWDGPTANAGGGVFTGESTYLTAGEAQILNAPGAVAASGTYTANDSSSNLIVVFSITAAGGGGTKNSYTFRVGNKFLRPRVKARF